MEANSLSEKAILKKNKVRIGLIVIISLVVLSLPQYNIIGNNNRPLVKETFPNSNSKTHWRYQLNIVTLDFTYHTPICISSDKDFRAFPGAGTAEDPYIIEGYNITTTTGIGIFITNTTKYFIIRNCYIEANGIGIYIKTVGAATAKIVNNICTMSEFGIKVDFSSFSTIANNTCINNSEFNIFLTDSDSSTVVNNICVDNYFAGLDLEYTYISGLYLESSSYCTVVNNTCINKGNGIFVYYSEHSIIVNNTCTGNDCGIRVNSSPQTTIFNNNCTNNKYDAVYVGYSDHSNISNNAFIGSGLIIKEPNLDSYLSYRVENNFVNGKLLGFFVNLHDVSFEQPDYGQIILIDCTNVIVQNQILNRCTIGINANYCKNIAIINNVCTQSVYGIKLYSSNWSIISNNICTNNSYGIKLHSSSQITITDNTWINNRKYAIYIVHSNHCNIVNNICTDNDYSIVLDYSSYSNISNNTCANNKHGGITLWDSNFSLLANNTCINNSEYAISLDHSHHSNITNNVFIGSGLLIRRSSLDSYLSYTVENNLINGKLLGFFVNLHDVSFEQPNYGQMILVNCTNVIVRNQNLNNSTISIDAIYCQRLILINNTCLNDYYDGISLVCSSSSLLINNTCMKSSNGIILWYSDSSLLINNICIKNDNGIKLDSSEYSTVLSNICTNNNYGIIMYSSVRSTIINNTFANNKYGLYLLSSDHSSVYNNIFVRCGLDIHELDLDSYLSYRVENNFVNGKPLGFFVNLHDVSFEQPDYGQIILINCTNVIVRNQVLNNSTIGIDAIYCQRLTLINNTCINNYNGGINLVYSSSVFLINNTCIENNYGGIILWYSHSSLLAKNTCIKNSNGIILMGSDSSIITKNLLLSNSFYGVLLNSRNCILFYNIFIYNGNDTLQACDSSGRNLWYNPVLKVGNYWSDWTGNGFYAIDGSKGLDLYPVIDIDHDKIDEVSEILVYHTNPFSFDTDGDGYSDYQEIKGGTDPLDPQDHPEITLQVTTNIKKSHSSFVVFVLALITLISLFSYRSKFRCTNS